MTTNAEPTHSVAVVRAAPKGEISPIGFQILMIGEGQMSPQVSSIMQKIKYLPGCGLGKNQQGISSFLDFKTQTTHEGLGYTGESTNEGKQSFTKKGGLYDFFVPEVQKAPGEAAIGKDSFMILEELITKGLTAKMETLVIQEEIVDIEEEEA